MPILKQSSRTSLVPRPLFPQLRMDNITAREKGGGGGGGGGGVILCGKRESICPDVFLKAFFYSLHCLFSQSISGWVVGGTCNAPQTITLNRG